MNKAKELIERCDSLINDIREYIVHTPHCIIYWIGNEEVQRFVETYPDDYEDMFDIQVLSVSESPSVRIDFHEHPDGVTSIVSYCVLPTFRVSTNATWLAWNEEVKELRIKNLREELEHFKRKVTETEELLKAEEQIKQI